MLRHLTLLLPALIPSWRFFDVIAPSPRIEYRLLNAPDAPADDWRAFRPRPQHVSAAEMLTRLFWNPAWNESLFLVSCAERLLDDEADAHSAHEIHRRIAAQLPPCAPPFLQFRVLLITREGEGLARSVAHLSTPQRRDA